MVSRCVLAAVVQATVLATAVHAAPDPDVRDLDTFAKARAQAQLVAQNLDPASRREYRKKLEVICRLLVRAQELADPALQAAELTETHSTLAYVYLELECPARAVLAGESAAFAKPPRREAAAGAAYALRAHGELIEKAQERQAPEQELEALNDRMRRLLDFVEKTWPEESTTDACRHLVGTVWLRQRKAREAAACLSRVSAQYQPASSLAEARWWWAVAVQQILADTLPDADKRLYQLQNRQALEGVPEIPDEAESETVHLYVIARIQLAQLLFEAKEKDRLAKLADQLCQRFPKFKNLDPALRPDLQRAIENLRASIQATARALSLRWASRSVSPEEGA